MHFTEEQWDTAYTWLCKQRRNYPVNSDIWHLRFNWIKEKPQLVIVSASDALPNEQPMPQSLMSD